jgi:hypothetical protein
MKQIAYGVSNFKKLIKSNALYIDKTKFIEKLESDIIEYPIFLRPRRFGKSLFISTLQYYYDIQYKDEFDTIFKDTYIGKNPTKRKSSYKVLMFSFSGIQTNSFEDIYRGFMSEIKEKIISFLQKYNYSSIEIEKISILEDTENLMNRFFSIIEKDSIYLLIDEYDNFANSILGSDIDKFKDIICKGGFVRSFYESIKEATQSGVIDRFFITGVTAITLDSLSSGFNMSDNITNHRDYNSLAGFTIDETKFALENIFQRCPNIDKEKLIKDVTNFYNGYRFSVEAFEKIYNSDMLIYFIKNFNIKKCSYPLQMLDSNIASDYGKIMQMFSIGSRDENYEVLEELINNNKIIASLKDRFDFEKGFFRDDFINLLFSMGFITITDTQLTHIIFSIPNYVIKHLYFNYFQIELERLNNLKFNDRGLKDALFALALQGDVKLFERELIQVLQILSNRDLQNYHEKHFQTLVLTVLNIADFYYIKSEQEYNKKYPDIMLLERKPFKVDYQYMFELKWVKKKENNYEKVKQDGINQIKDYLALSDIKELENLQSYLIVSDGTKLEMVKVEI